MNICVFAFGCHPDDIEFMMGGTLFLLKNLGAEIHYMNPANGCLGTTEYSIEQIISIRREEGKKAADYLGAVFHESIVNDLDVFYSKDLLRKVTAKVREIKPDIMLLTSLEDYMEDHMNAAKLGYTAAFSRGMTNYITDPEREPIFKNVSVYHAMPYGLHDSMNKAIIPDFFVDVETVLNNKRNMLALHNSQKKWLDESQGLDAYLETMIGMCEKVGEMSGGFRYAEGWRKHNNLGFCEIDVNPLETILNKYIKEN